MAILKLYGWSKATCIRRVATVLHELKVPFELIEVKLAEKEHKSPAYLEKQPFGQIPYIVRNTLCFRHLSSDIPLKLG
jgi:glutathione S-transferase